MLHSNVLEEALACQKLQTLASNKPASQPGAVLTSQCGREQEVRPVFPDDVVSDGAETGPPAQLPNGLQELGVQRQGEAIVLLSLQGEAVHLPAAELPATQATRTRTSVGGQAASSPNSQQEKKIKTSSRRKLLAFNTQKQLACSVLQRAAAWVTGSDRDPGAARKPFPLERQQRGSKRSQLL